MRTPKRKEKASRLGHLLLICVLSSCTSSDTGTINDPAPSGTLVAQGGFVGQNGRKISGTASVWRRSSGSTCAFVLRLESISAPSDATLNVIPLVNGAPSTSPTYYSLRAPKGTHNYAFSGAACSATWAQVSIVNSSESDTSRQIYGTATLASP